MQHFSQILDWRRNQFWPLGINRKSSRTVLRGKTSFKARTVHGHLYFLQNYLRVRQNIPMIPLIRIWTGWLQFEFVPENDRHSTYFLMKHRCCQVKIRRNSHAVLALDNWCRIFFAASAGTKIIFVGDPAQIPPVGQLLSPVDKNWLGQRT
jgi:hypothetical protein